MSRADSAQWRERFGLGSVSEVSAAVDARAMDTLSCQGRGSERTWPYEALRLRGIDPRTRIVETLALGDVARTQGPSRARDAWE